MSGIFLGRRAISGRATDWDALPVFSYDTDVGLGYGAKVFLLNYLGRSESLDLIADEWRECHSVVESIEDSVIKEDCVVSPGRLDNEISMLLIMRSLGGSGDRITFHSVMEFAVRTTDVSFMTGQEFIDVPAFQARVPSVRFEGRAYWTRKDYAGMKGEFRGWISDDAASVMLRAELRIFLGSIGLELEEYQRPDWDRITRLVQKAK